MQVGVRGADLIAAGIAPGPAVGRALTALRAALLDGAVADSRRSVTSRSPRRAGARYEHPDARAAAPARRRAVRGRVTTTRTGGVSSGPYATLNLAGTVGDTPDDVRANRELVCARLGIDAARSGSARRSTARSCARPAPPPGVAFLDPAHPWPAGDGLISDEPGAAVGVFGADCLPVLLWHRERPLVAAVHAGWRGLVDGILEAAVDALGGGAGLGAAIGAGVGPCCYPVSAEVRGRFATRFGPGVARGPGGRSGRRRADRADRPRGAAYGGLDARQLHLM